MPSPLPQNLLIPAPKMGNKLLAEYSSDQIDRLEAMAGVDRIVRDYVVANRPKELRNVAAAYSEDDTFLPKILESLSARGIDFYLATRGDEGNLGSYCRLCFPISRGGLLKEARSQAPKGYLPLAICRAIVKMVWIKAQFSTKHPEISLEEIFYDSREEVE